MKPTQPIHQNGQKCGIISLNAIKLNFQQLITGMLTVYCDHVDQILSMCHTLSVKWEQKIKWNGTLYSIMVLIEIHSMLVGSSITKGLRGYGMICLGVQYNSTTIYFTIQKMRINCYLLITSIFMVYIMFICLKLIKH